AVPPRGGRVPAGREERRRRGGGVHPGKRLFGELGQQTEGAVSPIRFVNIRETGGWSKDARSAMPKLAALLAAAKLPEAEPVPTVTYKSAGRVLIVCPLDQAERAAASLADALDVTVFAPGGSGAQER